MEGTWKPHREALRSTLLRTSLIAIGVGAAVAWSWGGGFARWPIAAVSALWPSLGGHCLEVWFLNWLRPRIGPSVHAVARLGVWFVGGAVLMIAMGATAEALGGSSRWLSWWIGGLAFVGVELIAHLGLQLRGRPSFYNGQG